MRNRVSSAGRAMLMLAVAIAGVAAAPAARAQNSDPNASTEIKVVYLKHISSMWDANDLQTTLRNTVAGAARLYYDPGANAITLRGTPEQLAQVEQLIDALDIPRPSYRLTYTFTASDNGQRVGVQHDSLVVVTGQETNMKEGSRVPVATMSSETSNGNRAVASDITYLDLGVLIDATLNGSPDGLSLKSKVTQSSIAEDKQSPSTGAPVIRQTQIEGTATVEPGKPLKLGTIDIPDSTRHIDVEVLVEPIHEPRP